jgi:putative membrane protein
MEPALNHAYFLVKTAHLVFVIAWMASVFYLPRILVNLVEAGDEPAVRARLLLMGRRLYRFGHVMFGLALLFGLGLWFGFGIDGGWLHAKLALVLLVIGYHHACGALLKKFENGANKRSDTWFRYFNEVPVLLLTAIVILVVVKPF